MRAFMLIAFRPLHNSIIGGVLSHVGSLLLKLKHYSCETRHHHKSKSVPSCDALKCNCIWERVGVKVNLKNKKKGFQCHNSGMRKTITQTEFYEKKIGNGNNPNCLENHGDYKFAWQNKKHTKKTIQQFISLTNLFHS